MTEFERILQECLQDLEQGASTVDECLSHHPEHASQLSPVLLANNQLERAGEVRVSEAFKARVRAKLIQEMGTHPRTSRLQPVAVRSGFMFIRLATSLAAILLALLVTGTAYAQRTLPGDTFYAWKLASEKAWRAVSSDPVETDLRLAARRVDELKVVGNDPVLRSQALEAYLETAARLKSEMDPENKTHVLEVLDSQVQDLNQLGILPEETNPDELPQPENPIPTPTATPPPILETPTPPPIDPTDLPEATPTDLPITSPEVTPTIQAPSEIPPTLQVSPEIIPAIETHTSTPQT
ncbi:MAG: hypothetical protein EHM33_11730 [Chloroflexi bacterium]|nr:MAG: hypothetical protein EHM33_11730 [Chloroflexota bacterium]